MNKFSFLIHNRVTGIYEDYSAYATNPVKHSELLDEQLDEAFITLKRCPLYSIEPMTEVRIIHTTESAGIFSDAYYAKILSQSEDNGTVMTFSAGKITETRTLDYIVANDTAIEVPAGSGRYDHQVYLIELTKIFEGFIGDSITFTNALGNNYLNNAKELLFSVRGLNLPNFTVGTTYSSIHSSYFKNPSANTPAVFPSIVNFVESIASQIPVSFFEPENTAPMTLRITNSSDVIVHEEKTEIDDKGHLILTITKNGVVTKTEDLGLSVGVPDASQPTYTIPERQLNLSAGVYTIYYKFYTINGYFDTEGLVMSYVNNRYPAKKWTITEVINRCFDLIEPLTKNETPRFKLSTTAAAKLAKIIAPEFAFTKMTLREQLKQIGGFIHAEPRISGKVNGQYIVDFDEYGSNRFSNISAYPYVSAGFKENINDYMTDLDSSADNLISQLDYAQGVIIEPWKAAYKTLRTETITARLAEDDSTVFETANPIYTIQKLEALYLPKKGAGTWDLTPYVFEATDYNSFLSAISGGYPYSRAFALYYTQGEKNIKGFFVKNENAINPIYSKYSIINILRILTGDNSYDLTNEEFYQIGLRITYIPIFSTRVKTSKQCIRRGLPRTLAYNQSANMIETRYYGKNLKGVAERLGNLEKTYTYIVPFLSNVPKVGTLFDNDYYISTVTWEALPSYIKVTVGLSKDFNRISEYVGINSEKRMWEISERMSVQRQAIYTDYLLFSYSNTRTGGGRGITFATTIQRGIFNYQFAGSDSSPAQIMKVRLKNKKEETVGTETLLPCVSIGMGNNLIITAQTADNYSAGQKIVKGTIQNADIKGFWGQYVPYTDYYGGGYYADIIIGTNTPATDVPEFNIDKANALPEWAGEFPTTQVAQLSNLIIRKDNREQLQISYELSAVTDDEDFIIGSALMRNSRWCNTTGVKFSSLQLYGFINRIDPIGENIDITKGTQIGTGEDLTFTNEGNNVMSLTLVPATSKSYVAWALCTPASAENIIVVNDNGEEEVQTIHKGGELVIGANKPYISGQKIYFSVQSKIY